MSDRATGQRKNKTQATALGKSGAGKTPKLQVTCKCGTKHLRPADTAVSGAGGEGGKNGVQGAPSSARLQKSPLLKGRWELPWWPSG